jgi:hypothetical protein
MLTTAKIRLQKVETNSRADLHQVNGHKNIETPRTGNMALVGEQKSRLNVKAETTFRQGRVIPFLKTLKNTWFTPIQQVTVRGVPDFLLGCRGRLVGLELKTDVGKVDPLQAHTLEQIEKCGGVAIVARPGNWDAVKDQLNELDRGESR